MADVKVVVTTLPKPKPAVPAASGFRRRWSQRLLALLLLVGILGWFTPIIVATTELRNQIPKFLFPSFPGEIQLGETTSNWFSPIVIKNLSIKGDDGQQLLDVEKFTTGETLLNLVTRPQKLGTLRFIGPKLHIAIRDDSSNLETTLTKFLAASSTGKPPADVIVEIANGRIEIEHAASNRRSAIEGISLRLTSTAGRVDECDLAIGNPMAATEEGEASHWLAACYLPSPLEGAAKNSVTSNTVKLRASKWKLDCLNALMPRLHSNAKVDGELNADTSVSVAFHKSPEWDWNGSVSCDSLQIAGIESLKRDKLAFDEVAIAGRCALANGRLAMHDFKITTDVAEATATGDFPLDNSSTRSIQDWLHSLFSNEDYHVTGRVDLKRLAALIPATLRVRDGVEVTAGEAKVELVGVAADGVRRWSGSVELNGLNATNQGKPLAWDKPLTAHLNSHRDGETIVVDSLNCQSDFLQLSGSGTLTDARFRANGDLAKLLANVERFVDLNIQQLSGRIKADGEIKRKDDNVLLTSNLTVDDFAYVIDRNSTWQERHLTIAANATARIDNKSALTAVKTGEIHLASGADGLDVILKSPINLTSNPFEYQASAALKGSAASWQNRIRPFVTTDPWKVKGTVNLTGTVTAKGSSTRLANCQLTVGNLEAVGPGWVIHEPEVTLHTSGQWDSNSQHWVSPKSMLKSKTLNIDVTDLDYGVNRNGLSTLVGMASYQADLSTISTWQLPAQGEPSYFLVGTVTGTAGIARQGGSLNGNIATRVEKFLVATPSHMPDGQLHWITLWKEPAIQLNGKGNYDGSSDGLTLQSARLEVGGLSLDANGKLDRCSTNQIVSLNGQLGYDWEQLQPRLGPQIRQNLQISGKGQRPFSINGSISPAVGTAASVNTAGNSGLFDLNGQAGVGWDSANVYGIKTSAAEISASLDHRVCRFSPIDIVVNDGRLHLTPVIDLNRDRGLLVLSKEKVLDGVTLTPEMCANAIKYIAPALADSAVVDGKISAEIEQASLPLAAPANGFLNGQLQVHRAQAKPGPLAQQVVGVMAQIQSILKRQPLGAIDPGHVALEMPEQQIPFKLEQRRVYHQGMTFVLDNVLVKTSGSVGLDTTLDLIAEIPMRDEWLGSNKALAGLKGTTLQIPITGTTSQPRVDPNILSNLAQQIGGSAVENLINEKLGGGLNEALNNGLDKLLKGRR